MVVLERTANGPRYNPGLLDFAGRYGFVPRLCRPYRARTKGKVERSIGYLRDRFFCGRTITSLEDLNTQLLAWLDAVANRREHATTGERPLDRLAREGLTPFALAPPGVGKSHLAVALGLEACRSRHRVRFTTAARLVAALAEAREQATYSRRLLTYTRPSLLIVDEVGFLPLDTSQAALLFEVVSRRYEQGSIVLTDNKSFGEWAKVFSGDSVIATAILDRLLHHSHVINIRGESYRLKDKRKAGVVKTKGG